MQGACITHITLHKQLWEKEKWYPINKNNYLEYCYIITTGKKGQDKREFCIHSCVIKYRSAIMKF